MQPLTPAAILDAWETGLDQHPIDRALTLLLTSEPGETRARLAQLSIPERDARLLDLRARTLGSVLQVFTRCHACGEHVEFAVRSEDLAGTLPEEEETWELEVNDRTFRFRLPDSHDLAAAVECGEPNSARRCLAERCTLAATGEGGPEVEGGFPDPAIAALAEGIAGITPQSEALFELSCPTCGGQWREALDIAAFFWQELAAQARRILGEVDALARTYHWSEAEILALSAARRQSYLDLVRQ